MAGGYRRRQLLPEWGWAPPTMIQPLRVMPSQYLTMERPLAQKSGKKKSRSDRPHTIDVIGSGPETTICGHIDLLYRLPIHNGMHRKLLETFRDRPGNYEGKYNDRGKSKANVVDYGNGYLAIHFTEDISRPEMSEFLLAHDWRLLNTNCTERNGREVIYEKWTNVNNDPQTSLKRRPRSHSMPRRYY